MASEIRYAYGVSSLGHVLMAASRSGVAAILLGTDRTQLLGDLRRRFPEAEIVAADTEMSGRLACVCDLIENPSAGFSLSLDLMGTPFQVAVWQALCRIPAGTTVTYAELARLLGRPLASRAVAAACAANPIAVAVPCHRVIRADGSLGGYRWGLEVKRALLDREAPPRRPAAA